MRTDGGNAESTVDNGSINIPLSLRYVIRSSASLNVLPQTARPLSQLTFPGVAIIMRPANK